ncbi:MAG: GAF domain-containing protein [Acidobacteria bacterium]|nr:GAF domain-containing protein [Acidobacteriota bacterium]
MNTRKKILLALLGVIASIAFLGYLNLKDLSLSQSAEAQLEDVNNQRRFLQKTWTDLGRVLQLVDRIREWTDPIDPMEFHAQTATVLSELTVLHTYGQDLEDQKDIFALRRELITLRQEVDDHFTGSRLPEGKLGATGSALGMRVRTLRQLQWGVSRFFDDRFHAMSLSAHRRVQWSYIRLFSVLCVSVLFAAGFGFFLNRTMLGPLQKLQLAAERIHVGNLDISLDTSGTDEFAEVSEAFVRMSRFLKEKFAEEKRLNRELDQVNRRLEREKQDFERLVEISNATSSIQDPERVLAVLTEQAMKIVRCFRCTVHQIDPDQPETAIVLSSTLKIREGPLRLNLDLYPEIRAAAVTGSTIQIDDIHSDERMRDVAEVASRAGVSSILAAPMLHQGRLLGVISFLRDGPKEGKFTPWEKRLAETIAGIGAISIENAKQHAARPPVREHALV